MSQEKLPDWKRMGDEEFNRAVEGLLIQIHALDNPGWTVTAYDGRGGDGGCDVVAYRPDGTIEIIYQLKYFPEGFSGGHAKSRRPQITKSYRAARKLNPKRWVLVIPGNPTVHEEAFVKKLVGTDASWEVMGQAELDIAVARFPDWLRGLTRHPTRELAEAMGVERMLLESAGDVELAMRSIAERVACRSVYWNIRTSIDEYGNSTQSFVPLRRDSQEREPIGVVFELHPAASADTARAIQQFADFHGPDVTVPAQEVARLMISGPSFVAGEHFGVQLELQAVRSGPKACEIRAVGPSGETLGSVAGVASMSTPGERGLTLDGEFVGGLRMRMTIPLPELAPHDSGRAEISQQWVDHNAVDIERALSFHDALARGAEMELWVERRRWFITKIGAPAMPAEIEPAHRQLIEDMSVIAKHFDVVLIVPESMGTYERMEIRKCRLLLDGECVLLPEFRAVTMTLNGSSSDEFENWLACEPVGVRRDSPLHFVIRGMKLPLTVVIFHTAVRAVNGQAAVDALRSGTANGYVVDLEPIDDTPLMGVILSRRSSDPNTPIIPRALGVPGVAEHPALARLISHGENGYTSRQLAAPSSDPK